MYLTLPQETLLELSMGKSYLLKYREIEKEHDICVLQC